MRNEPALYFISGVSGVGKTSVIAPLRALLPAESFDIRDFDERGVPDGEGTAWHDSETRYWINVANINAGRGESTIVTGFSVPSIIRRLARKGDLPVKFILLSAAGDTIRSRLVERHATEESQAQITKISGVAFPDFVEMNASNAGRLLQLAKAEGCPVIETDGKDPEAVAREIRNAIDKSINLE